MQALRITIAGLAVLTAVGAGFVLLRTPDARDPGSVLPEPSTAARDGSAGGAELAPGPDPAPRSMAAVDSATSFRVVSAEGIDLLAVQWRDDDGEWQPANGPAVPRDARAVRAAGHGATDVDPAADDVVLTADALLRLECPGLGAAVLDPLLDTQFGPPDPERAAAAYLGPHGDDALVLAVDTSRWSRAESIGAAHVRVSLRPGGALFVDWVARSQERRTERIALDPSWLDAPAQSLRIVEAPGPPATGDVRRRVEVRLLGDADARQVHRSNRLLVSMHQRLRRWTSTDSHEPTVEIPGVPTGDEVLVRWRRGDGWYGRLRHTHDGGEATIQLRPPTRILGRVVDESGAGIAGVEPSIRFPRDGVRPRLSSAWNANRATETDESGAFELVLPHEVPFGSPEDALPEAIPTDGVLRVREPGHATLQRDVALAPGGVVALGDLVLVSTAPHLVVRSGEALAETGSVRLDAERRLAGRVVDTDGAPVEGASLRLTGERRVNRGFTTDIPPSWVHVARIDDTTSDADGRFAFEQLPDGPYELQLFALGDRRRSRSFDVAGGDEDLELVLDDRAMDKVVLRGRVTDARTGEPLDRFTVCPITDDSGMNREFVDPNGQYEITGLDEGRYSVVFSADGYSKFETDEAKYEEGRHEVDAALWPEATLRFAVVDENGELLQGAVLRAFDLDGEPLSIGTPRSSSRNRKALDGRGVAHGLPSRPITVEVEWRGDVARHAIDLTNPIDDEVELSIARTPEPVLGRVELLVLTDDANPVDLRRRFEAIRSERDMEGLAEFMGTALESAPSQPVSLVFSSDAHRRRLTATVKPLPSGEFEITESQTDGLSGFAGPSMSSTTSYSAPVPALSLRMPIGSWRVEIQRDGETVAPRSVEVTEPASATQEIDPDDPWSGIPDVHFVTLPAPR